MEQIPQLFMRHPDLSKLPPLDIPAGFTIKTHTDDMVEKWENIIYKAFGSKFDFQQCIVNGRAVGHYNPEHVLYLMDGKKIVATATAVERDDYPGEGWFRMIASDPEVRGKGLGKLICLAALYRLKERGYKSAVLSTDDDRLPALKTYLSLGFKPIYFHESHEDRWNNVIEKINSFKKA